MRSKIDAKLTEHLLESKKLEELNKKLSVSLKEEETASKAQQIMQKAATLSQEHLAAHLSRIVTQAVQAVVPERPYEFVCEFVERRGSTEADLYLTKDGEKFDILGGTGGGVGDVCSYALKVAYLLLSNTDKVLIIDEASRHINSPVQRERFAQVLKELSKEFGIQIIMNTTLPELLEVSDKVFTFTNKKDQTEIVNERTTG